MESLKGKKLSKYMNLKTYFLIFNCALLSIGTTGGPLLMRLYFLHGGTKVWLSCWLETGGWPMMIPPIIISYIIRRRKNPEAKLIHITPRLFCTSAFLGTLTGLDDFMYAYGVSLLPVSTSSLLISTQLAFTAAFAFVLVKQKFTSYSLNAVFMLTLGAVILGLHTSSDRPAGESVKDYYFGFFMTLAAAALYGFVLPMVEFTYSKATQTMTYPLVMEMQTVIALFATIFCTIGMIAHKDFQGIAAEGREFGLGEPMYYVVLVLNAVLWQMFFLGVIGVVFCAESLLSGILIAVFLPVTEVLAVIFYHEPFKAEKGIALGLSLWGFVSYFYGEFKIVKKKQKKEETEIPLNVV